MISDLSMPGMDGLAVMRRIERRRAGLPSILRTGFATRAAEVTMGGTLCAPFALLGKPVDATVLSDRVAVLLEGPPRA